MFNTNYGHFVSTYGVHFDTVRTAPNTWSSNPLSTATNNSYSNFQTFDIFDELYDNMTFIPGQTFGDNINDINPLFSNDQNPASQNHNAGFTKLIDVSSNSMIGKVAYLEAGERRESININHPFGQVIRNAVVWLADSYNQSTVSIKAEQEKKLSIYPNPSNNEIYISTNNTKPVSLRIFTLTGTLILHIPTVFPNKTPITVNKLTPGIYLVEATEGNKR